MIAGLAVARGAVALRAPSGAVGGLLVFDDIWMPAVIEAISYLLADRAYELVPVDAEAAPTRDRLRRIARRYRRLGIRGNGTVKRLPGNLCVLRKTADDDRPWNRFRRF